MNRKNQFHSDSDSVNGLNNVNAPQNRMCEEVLVHFQMTQLQEVKWTCHVFWDADFFFYKLVN